MNIKKLISTVITSAMVMTSAVTAYAEDVQVDTDVYQPDRICGYLNINGSTDADVYLKVYMHTPETAEEGYVVYDTVIRADTVHVTNNYVYELEYNSLNIDKGTYDGYYKVIVGVPRYSDSNNPEDIAEVEFPLIVEDIDFSGYETFCNINVTVLTEEELKQPLCVESGVKPNKTYDLTFSCIETPEIILYGDANADGKLNVRDAAFIASKLAGGHSDELPAISDINADGNINVRDAAFVAAYLAGLVTLPEERPTEPTTQAATTPAVTTTAKPTEAVTTASSVMQDPTEAASSVTTTVAADPTEAVTSASEASTETTDTTETQTPADPTENSADIG